MYSEYSPIRNRLFYHVIKPDLLEIFSQFTKVLVLRLDLYLPKDKMTLKYLNQSYTLLHKQVFLEGCLKHSYIQHYCIREYTDKRGLHMHCLVFLDGERVQSGIAILRMLGEKWRVLTGGDYHNVNAYHADKPDTFGCLGIIRYTELERIARLYDYFKYFLKQLDDWTWLESIGESRKAKRFTSGRLAHASAYKPNRRDYAIDKSYLENIRLDRPFDTTINYAVYLSENNPLLT